MAERRELKVTQRGQRCHRGSPALVTRTHVTSEGLRATSITGAHTQRTLECGLPALGELSKGQMQLWG